MWDWILKRRLYRGIIQLIKFAAYRTGVAKSFQACKAVFFLDISKFSIPLLNLLSRLIFWSRTETGGMAIPFLSKKISCTGYDKYSRQLTMPCSFFENLTWWNFLMLGIFLKWCPRKVLQSYVATMTRPSWVATSWTLWAPVLLEVSTVWASS